MGMSIDEAIETLLDTRSYGTADIAKSVAIDTMRKYQKIREITGNYGFDNSWLCLKKIRKVIEGWED